MPAALIRRMAAARKPRDFTGAIRGTRKLSIIAEVKRSSPSSPNLFPNLNLVDFARKYRSAGAAAISVLTEEDHFGGNLEDLDSVSREVRLPVLRKDFTIDPYQIYEARAFGASAVLLIVRALSDAQLKAMIRLAKKIRLAALVEAHDEYELERALSAGAEIVGINNRNLSTLKTDLAVSLRLLPLIPKKCVAVAESGYANAADLAPLRDLADAALIGTAFLKNPGKIKKILRGRG